MLIQLSRNLAPTLLISFAILLAFAPSASANHVSPGSVHRRDHAHLNRMAKMRPAARQIVKVIKSPPADQSSTTSPSSVSSSSPTLSDSVLQSPSVVASSSPSPLLTSSSVSSASATSSVSLVSSSSSTTTTSSATSSSSSLLPSSTSKALVPSPQNGAQVTQTPIRGQSVSVDSVTLTSHVPAASSSSNADNAQIGGSSLPRTTITILIVLAASVGGCAIIWTIIRKWKFRPSAEFEDRLEPINWQPAEHDSGLPTHRKVPSTTSSFHSGGHESGGLSRSNTRRSLTPIPDHDFTAGLPHLRPPQPQMQEAFQSGPSVNRGYDNYSNLPPHHQGGYGAHDAYDHSNTGIGY
ncbi:hypothetical protein BGW80DRAFT_1247241 [Lactifluus volemus]|nr:hypothetical protein BGW80DRAFT_1247241 [Lactifluus volemus]